MYITDLCRKREIGANCILLEIGPYRLLIDAGLHPKYAGWEATPDFSSLPANSLDFILLTHCHLDHVGSLPLIAERHPNASILTSIPSQLLLGRILINSHSVMKRQKEALKINEYPLYSLQAIGCLERRILNMAYKRPRVFSDKNDSIEITFYAAGHVAGAAGISIKYNNKSCFISGDVLFQDQETLPGAQFPEEPHDVLILETTRGATERLAQHSREQEIQRLIDTIADTLDNGGSCLIPAFAFGRMQEVMAIIHRFTQSKDLPKVPIFCSGLGMALVEYFDHISRRTGLLRFREKILKDMGIRTLKEALTPGKTLKKQAIYILSSGMLVENTPSYMAAAALLGDKRHSFCFVGYCDPDTPGGELLMSPPEESFYFKALDYAAPIHASIERFDLSGHADRDELIQFAQAMNPSTVVLTHGEAAARDWFIQKLTNTLPASKVIDPVPGQRLQI